MASLTRIATARRNPSLLLLLLLLPPALFVACGGIAIRLLVGGLSFCTTEDELSELELLPNKVTKKSKGLGFVTFASQDEAAYAIIAMDRKPLNGRVIYVSYAKARVDFGGSIPIARGPPKPSSES